MKTGDLVAGRFSLQELAAEGGMGRVFRALDQGSGEEVALKSFGAAMGIDRAVREIDVLSRLDHPNIVRHVASGISLEGELYLAMEWLDGEPLDARIARGALSVDDALCLGEALARALAAAHREGVVHRDVKPENVVLVGASVDRPKLVDFGLARVEQGAELTSAGMVLGTPAYMAPEQVRGGAIDARADLFGLGVLLYEAIAGAPPFSAAHPLGVMAKILLEPAPALTSPSEAPPRTLAKLVAKLLEKEPDARPASALEVASALAALREERERAGRASFVPGSLAPDSLGRISALPASAALGRREMRLSSVLLVAPFDEELFEEPGAFGVEATGASAYEQLSSAVHRHAAELERLGDGALLVLVPGREEALEQAARAARCALDVRRILPRQPMVLVTGRSERGERLPVGELLDRGAALLARRVTKAALARGGVGVDAATAALLERCFVVHDDSAHLSLVAERDLAREQGAHAAELAPFVGREAELAELCAALDACARGHRAEARVVRGAVGIGKTRLARALRELLAERAPARTVLGVRGETARAGVPLGLAARALEGLFGIELGEGLEAARQRIQARVEASVGAEQALRVASFLGELVGVPFDDEALPLLRSARADRIRMGDQLRAAWRDFLEAELRRGPVVFLLDDLQLADAPSLELFGASLREHAERALALVAFSRDDAVAPAWPGLSAVELGALDPQDAEALARAALGERATDDAVTRIVAQAEGSPLALEELALAELEGRAHRTPPTLLALAQARLAALGDEERRTLRAASIFGGRFDARAVAALLAADELAAVERELEALTGRGLLWRSASGGARYAFRSSLLRDAAYATLTDEDRELGHRLAASHLAEHAQSRDAPVVAHHYEAGAEPRQAAIWFAKAAELALEANAFERAAELAGRGALAGASGALLGRVRLLETEAFRHAGRNVEMFRAGLSGMEHLPLRSPPWWTAYANAVLGAIRLGEKAELSRLAAMASSGALVDLPAATARAAHYLQFAGQREPADELLAAVSEKLGAFAEDPARWAWAYRAHATKALLTGDVGGYLAQLELAVRSFASSGDVRELTLERANLGFARSELGLYEEAEVVLREAIASAERLGLAHTVAVGTQNLGAAIAKQGRPEEGKALLEEALERFTSQRNARMAGNTRSSLSRVWLVMGEPQRALEAALQGVADLELVPPLLPGALASAARARLALGDTERALDEAREAASRMVALGQVDEGEALVRLVLAEALEAKGLHEEARTAIGAARERLLARAAKLTEPAWRASFLERVAENRLTLELSRSWDA
jgi:eukaryotic-like serine/threonine-protein kinase